MDLKAAAKVHLIGNFVEGVYQGMQQTVTRSIFSAYTASHKPYYTTHYKSVVRRDVLIRQLEVYFRRLTRLEPVNIGISPNI